MNVNTAFIETVRPMFGGTISTSHLEGIEALIGGANQFGVTQLDMQAYILGTAYWETDGTMQPIEEKGKGTGYDYGKKLKCGDGPGKRIPYETPDKIYYGRGHTQNSWYENYQMLTAQAYARKNNWDFLNEPELLLQMAPSVWATIHCMWHGTYTGVGLPHFFTGGNSNFLNARKIINGLDQAQKIANLAETYFKALQTLQ